MYRVIKMSSAIYAMQYDDDDLLADVDNIREIVGCGEPVILVDTLDKLEIFGIDECDVEVV